MKIVVEDKHAFSTGNKSQLLLVSSLVATALSAAALLMMPSAIRGVLSYEFPAACLLLPERSAIDCFACGKRHRDLALVSCNIAHAGLPGAPNPKRDSIQLDVPGVWIIHRRVRLHSLHGRCRALEFIIACGFTHFMDVVVLWKPVYWLAGDIKLVTALASVVTAIALPGLVPQVHAMLGSARVSEERRKPIRESESRPTTH